MSLTSSEWLQRLPRTAVVDRVGFLVEQARGRRVLHVGYVDDRLLQERLDKGEWLHSHLAAVASSIVGLDIAAAGVQHARSLGYKGYVADAQDGDVIAALRLAPFDVVIAGEVIEHLDAPGPFFSAMRQTVVSDGALVLTTPNPYRPLNSLVALAGRELIHPDHTSWQSPHTLRTLAERRGWSVLETRCYHQPSVSADPGRPLRDRLLIGAAGTVRRFSGGIARWAPWWSDGFIVVCGVRDPAE